MHDLNLWGEEIIVNILIVIIPVLAYQLTYMEIKNHQLKYNLIFGFFCSFSIVLCLHFPVFVSDGIIVDMRLIPLFLAILYGGFIPGLIASFVFVTYRFYMGGDGFFLSFLATVPLLGLSFYFHKKFVSLSPMKRIYSIMILVAITTTCISTVGYLYFLYTNSMEIFTTFFQPFSFFTFISFLTMLLIVALIESIHKKERLLTEAHLSEKLFAVGELAASVAHEIRNPMTTVRGFLQIFQRSGNLNPDQKKYADLMISELDRAHSIINDYLTLAKPQAEDVSEVINLHDHIKMVIDVMSSFALYNGVEVMDDLNTSLYLKGNKEKLSQVLINIIKNSIEASRPGTVVEICSFRSKEYGVIEITDKGNGMSKEQIKRIGTPFYSTKNKGTGLGMMICYRITKNMKGTITINSEEGKGTAVQIKIPLYFPEN